MGIHGLTGFIDRNQHLLHFHRLHDCSVIIDGNNLYHFLYSACHVQCNFGGDYDVYRDRIINTFESFKKCGITPYIVLDGAYTVDGRKLKTSLSRANARIRLIDVMANNRRGQALPTLAYETFVQTLTELDVPHVTCQFEADNEIAVLANKLKCPVISNDSDFYIFDLSHGFLPLDYLDFRVLHQQTRDGATSYSYLHCHRYCVDDFINSFDGLSRTVLPVFASMLGNDFIKASAFKTLFAKVKVPRVVSKKFSLPQKLSKVISVLHWLDTHGEDSDFSVIKDELLSFIKPERKKKVEQMFVSSVNGYVDVENFQGFDLFKYFTLGSENCPVTVSDDFKGYNGAIFPEWFVRAVCRGDITPSILNSVILHRVIFLAQVEDLSLPTSFLCSANVRAVLYGILLKDDQPEVKEANSGMESEKTEHISEMKLDVASGNLDHSSTEIGNGSSELSVSEIIPDREEECEDKSLSGSGTFPVEEKRDSSEQIVDSQQLSCIMRCPIDLKDKNKSDMEDIVVEEDLCMTEEEQLRVSEIISDRDREQEFEDKSLSGSGTIPDEENRDGSEQIVDSQQLPSIKRSPIDLKDENKSDMEEIVVEEDLDMAEEENNFQVMVNDTKQFDRKVRPKQTCVEEYNRFYKHLRKSLIEPIYTIGEITVPGLHEISSMKIENRKLFLLSALGVDPVFIDHFSDDLQLFVACLRVWIDNANPKIATSHLESVLVGLILLAALQSLATRKNANIKGATDNDSTNTHSHKSSSSSASEKENIPDNSADDPDNKPETRPTSINIKTVCSNCDVQHLINLRQNLEKYHRKPPTFNHKNHYDRKISHAFAQLQACVVDIINLNKVLRFPLLNSRPSELINGTFLYRLQTELMERPQPELFLATMLGKNSPLFYTFQTLRALIVDYVGQESFVTVSCNEKKSRKRKNKGKSKEEVSRSAESGDVLSDNDESTVSSVPGFDVANKFSLLSV